MSSSASSHPNNDPSQINRLVDWNADVLLRLLKQIVAKRIATGKGDKHWDAEPVLPEQQQESSIVLDEVTDVIVLPVFSNVHAFVDPESIDLPHEVEEQLKAYVAAVANAYHSNPFHCLQHASAVSMALTKLLSRIVVKELNDIQEEDSDYSNSESDSDSDDDDDDDDDDDNDKVQDRLGSSHATITSSGKSYVDAIASHLHNHTFGITSDPLTQFALVLSAFIHAVDHKGLSNADMMRDEPEVAAAYRHCSIIEQCSIDKAWKKLMEPAFVDLRRFIYSDQEELRRFRQVVVFSVMATNIEDEELQDMRMRRWEKTFSVGRTYGTTPEDVNRKATIVIEHLMQAADIFHTMQPWIVYEKWSTRAFEEQYIAFQNGKSSDNPIETWYQSELDFFDNYAIPLAMQLKVCDAFVVSGDEYLNYTLKNRQQLAAKGKGMIETMTARLLAGQSSRNNSNDPLVEGGVGSLEEQQQNQEKEKDDKVSKHVQRLVDWNVEMLKRLLKLVVAKRKAQGIVSDPNVPVLEDSKKGYIVDEFSDVIEFPAFDPSATPHMLETDEVDLGVPVISQLCEYVSDISAKFRNHPFHCIDHGSHVCMTTRKMLSRMTTVNGLDRNEASARQLHNRTYGISSDPLAHFAVVFASLILDVDHPGVPNSQLVSEGSDLAVKYKNRSIAEQQSFDLAWSHLMQPKFADLRACIYADEHELKRFRQILINSILSTDFVDEELTALRKDRWDRAFVRNRHDTSEENTNRKATIVLEMMMQSSDIFHATQNWHLYHKWNERHFQEMYKAYNNGRLFQDPSIFWYKSEMIFFDEHVIPMAKKLNDCGVFDTTGDEQLSFALSNRQQWAAKGGDLLASIIARFHGAAVEKTLVKRAHKRLSLSASQA